MYEDVRPPSEKSGRNAALLTRKKFQSHHRHVTDCEKVKRIEKFCCVKKCNNEEFFFDGREGFGVMTKLCDILEH